MTDYRIPRHWIFDETHLWNRNNHIHWAFPAVAKPSKIRVTLSRPLTWAEWEYLQAEISFFNPKADQGVNRQVIHLTGNQTSRQMFEEFASHLANEFVNVYPKAVWTKQEMA